MNSKFQILLTTAALAIVGVSIASLYGDDGSPPAATPVPAAVPATPALAPAATRAPSPRSCSGSGCRGTYHDAGPASAIPNEGAEDRGSPS